MLSPSATSLSARRGGDARNHNTTYWSRGHHGRIGSHVPAIVLGGIAEELRTRGIRAPRTRGTLRRSLGLSITAFAAQALACFTRRLLRAETQERRPEHGRPRVQQGRGIAGARIRVGHQCEPAFVRAQIHGDGAGACPCDGAAGAGSAYGNPWRAQARLAA